jgi:ATP-dependent RNA helicase RhlB
MEFKDLSLHDGLFKGVEDAGYVTCTLVQEEVFKIAFEGRDLFVQSQTGTGKTAAYLITIFQRLLTKSDLKNRKTLILVPTRELAVQVTDEAEKLLKNVPGLTVGAFYGGVGYRQQEDMIKDDVDIMIGTPGRLIDLHQQGKLMLKTVGFLVIDEADRMFDMGFIDDLRKIIRFCPPNEDRQTMLFSATLNVRVKTLAWDYTVDAAEVAIEPEHITVEEITHELYHVGSDEKFKLLLGLMKRENPENALIFCNTRHDAEIVSKRLKINGIECDYLMGDLPQKQRLALIDGMKDGRIKFLVATDVAARGLDIQDLALVINYDVPNEAENYVHRIGRTARAGKSGKAITLADEKFVYGLPAIERYLGMKVPVAFAEESLYAEDKSAGMRIRFEHAREFSSDGRGGHGQTGGRGPSRSGDPRRGDPRRSAPRQGERPDRSQAVRASVRDVAGLKNTSVPTGPGAPRPEQRPPQDQRPQSQRRRGEKARNEPPIAATASRQARIAQATGGNAPAKGNPPKQGQGKHRDERAPQNTLYQLPMEERIAYYRKKYGKETDRRDEPKAGGKQPSGRQDAPRQGRSGAGQRPPANRNGNQPARQSGKGEGTANPPVGGKAAQNPSPKSVGKKSIIQRIVGLFKK